MSKDEQFKAMHRVLSRIASEYASTSELMHGCEEAYGLEYEEALEMSYENMQAEASLVLIKCFEKNQPGVDG